MSSYSFIYIVDGKQYLVEVTKKRMKSIRYVYKDGVFKVSIPKLFVTQSHVIEGLNKYAKKLIKADVRSQAKGDDFIYILGYKVAISDSGEIAFSNGERIVYKDCEDMDKKLKKWFLKYMKNREIYYENLMGLKGPYKVHVKKMTTRYGSNSLQTRSVSYSMVLLHYSPEIIDSVIVHELAHDKERNHSKAFYNVVYKYCPNYDALHKRLRKGEF